MTPVQNDLWRDHCPVCAHTAIRKLGDVPVAGPVAYSTHTVALERVPEIWVCRQCTSWFTQNAVPESAARALYATGSSGERWAAEPFERAKCPELITEFDRHVVAGTRLLDIGCSSGQLLDYAKSRGVATSGVDYSTASAAVLRGKGHRFSPSLADLDGEQFDVVTAFDVIEHVYALPAFLADAARLLAPGGKLIILTGDIASIGAKVCGSHWWYVSYPEHIVFPSRRYLQARGSGLRHVRTIRTYASIGYRMPWLRALRSAIALARSTGYAGLPAIGPDHMLAVLQRA